MDDFLKEIQTAKVINEINKVQFINKNVSISNNGKNMMEMHSFDTYKYIKQFQSSGFNEQQEEAIVRTLVETRDFDLSRLATKDQLAMVEEKLSNRINSVEVTLDAKIDNIKNELKADIATSHASTLKWIMPLLITLIGMVATMMIKLLS